MESYLPRRAMTLGVQRRLSRLYNDTKKSSDFVQEPVQAADDPEIKALHRKLRIQKDRLVSWGLEWSDPNQSAEIDESLNEAGLTDLVGSIMATIKDILAEAEPLWLASKRLAGSEKTAEKASGDRKAPLIVWDKNRFEDLVQDLTASIDTLCELSRTRSSAALALSASGKLTTAKPSTEDMRPYGSTRIQTPRQIDPQSLTGLRSTQVQTMPGRDPPPDRPQEIFFMSRQAYADLMQHSTGRPWSPLLVEYANFDPIYSATGIMPEMTRFEKLSAGLQTESSRSSGAWIGLPLLLGYYEDMERSRLALIYSFPPTFNAVTFESTAQHPVDNLSTLANLLSRPNFEPTLEAKFRLAYNLANTVFDMHSRGITHGNLHASTISFGSTAAGISGTNEVDIRRPLISCFDIFPNSPSASYSSSTFLLHRHPLDPRTTSQSPLAVNSDTKTLDLYSLAMMLVSIGLWTTLENLVPNLDSPSVPESVLGQLAIRCGTPYMRAVQACWNAVELELSRPGNGDEIIRQVQTRAGGYLEACCILDGVSGFDDRLNDDFMHVPSSQIVKKRNTSSASLPVPSVGTAKSQSYDTKRGSPQERSQSFLIERKPVAEARPVEGKSEKPKEKQPKLRLYPQVPLPDEIVEQWNEILMPQINLALRHFYRKHPESVEISLESIGESPQKATPTVLVVCTSVNKVRAILNKKLGILFDGTTTDVSLKVCRGSVVRSRKGPTRSMTKGYTQDPLSQHGTSDEEDSRETPVANPDYQKRPHNGASIGAWIGDKHLPPVSLGGVILVDNKPYGMTVHHMLDDPDRPFQAPTEFEGSQEEATRASAPTFRSSAAAQDMSYLTEGEASSENSDFACEFSDTESEYSVTDITSDEEDEDEDDDEEFNEPGDIPGIEPGCGNGYIITQPALDDVPVGFYPSPETENEDHIDTYSVGEVYASSGIRRRKENDLVHEIDWALFEFQDDRLPDNNIFPATIGGEYQSWTLDSLQPVEVAPAKSLPGLDVQCMARTSGSQAGRILPALTTVKIYGRTSPSHSYQVSGRIPGLSRPVTLPNQTGRGVSLGIPGDSGAWVVDRIYGRLCGHVLAWSERKQVAYICPMDVLLLDIAETLQATDVRLPNGEPVVSIVDNRAENDIVEVSGSEAWTEDDIHYAEESFQSLAREGEEPAKQPERLPLSVSRGRLSAGVDILASNMDELHINDKEIRYQMK